MVQILVLLNPSTFQTVRSAGPCDSYNTTDILCRARVQHPQTEHGLCLMCQRKDESSVLLLQ